MIFVFACHHVVSGGYSGWRSGHSTVSQRSEAETRNVTTFLMRWPSSSADVCRRATIEVKAQFRPQSCCVTCFAPETSNGGPMGLSNTQCQCSVDGSHSKDQGARLIVIARLHGLVPSQGLHTHALIAADIEAVRSLYQHAIASNILR